jgi:hypothetical protein
VAWGCKDDRMLGGVKSYNIIHDVFTFERPFKERPIKERPRSTAFFGLGLPTR